MALQYGIHAEQQNAAANKPHILSFATGRTVADDTLFESWNGSTNAARRFAVDKDGKLYSAAATAGDLLYAVTGGVSAVRRFDSLAIGTAGQVLVVNGGGTAPAWASSLGVDTTGNAATATALQTARTINGVSFNGTANITVPAAAGTLTGSTLAAGVTASSLTSVGTLTGLTVSGETLVTARLRVEHGATTMLRLRNTGAGAGAQAWNIRVEADGALHFRSVEDTNDTTVAIGLAADHATGLVTATSGFTVASGQSIVLSGVTVTGTPTWASAQAITLSTASQPNITSLGTLTGLICASTIFARETTAWSVTSNQNPESVFLANSGTAQGSGNYGASVAWGSVNTTGGGTRRAAIVNQQTGADPDNIGLHVFVHPSGTGTDDLALIAEFGFVGGANAVRFPAAGGVTIGTTLTLTGATVAGTPTWSSAQAITLSTAAQPNVTSVGTLTSLTVSGLISANGGITVQSGDTLTLTGATVAGQPTWSSTQAMNISGNAATATLAAEATALETARTINGVSFNGTANITVAAAAGTLTGSTLAAGVTASSLTSVGTLTGLTVSGEPVFSGLVHIDDGYELGTLVDSTSSGVDLHDYDRGGTYAHLHFSHASSKEITGITGGTQGQVLLISNSGGNLNIIQSIDSIAANRFQFGSGVGITLTDDAAMFIYVAAHSRWVHVFGGVPS